MTTSIMKPTTPPGRQLALVIDGHRVGARIVGEKAPGRTLVMFHSLLADDGSFDLIALPLSLTNPVIVFNLPGFGFSDRVDGGLDAVADRLAAAVRLLALQPAPVLLGNGYGAFLALRIAMRHPDLVDRLVLAGCGAAFSEPGRAAFRAMSAGTQAKGLAGIADIAMRRLFSPEYQVAHPDLIEAMRQRFIGTDDATFHQACAALAALDWRGQLASVTQPVLVMAGEFDEATPQVMARALADELPNARLHILDGCAHVPQLQAPQLFMTAIEHFIGESPSPL